MLRDWDDMLKTRNEAAMRCWDHISTTPEEPVGSRYVRLKGQLSTCVFQGQVLPQWQWEIDNRGRVKVGIGKDVVVIFDVSTGHPRGNE